MFSRRTAVGLEMNQPIIARVLFAAEKAATRTHAFIPSIKLLCYTAYSMTEREGIIREMKKKTIRLYLPTLRVIILYFTNRYRRYTVSYHVFTNLSIALNNSTLCAFLDPEPYLPNVYY